MIYTLINNPFFLNALIAAVLAAILCSMIGTYVVTRRMVIMGGGMAHASLGGVGLGAYFGFSPLLGAAAFCLLSGFGIRRLSRLGGELALAAAHFHPEGRGIGLQAAPVTLQGSGLQNTVICALVHPGLQIAQSSHSHLLYSSQRDKKPIIFNLSL